MGVLCSLDNSCFEELAPWHLCWVVRLAQLMFMVHLLTFVRFGPMGVSAIFYVTVRFIESSLEYLPI
jgi:disulfide bond formation protein DsbB